MGKRIAAAFLVCALVMSPVSARTLSLQSPAADAQSQAERDFNSMNWLAAGCLLGVIGWFIATMHKPEPPSTSLLGKSPDYVAQYRDAYRERSNKLASSKAMTGCLIGTAAQVGAWLLLFAASESAY